MKKSKGFTLIEILVVVTIIGLLTSIAMVTYSSFLKQSRDAKRKTDLGQVAAALEMYRSNNDTYPTALTTLTTGTIYIQSVPTDPKSTSYVYYYNPVDSAGGPCDGSASDSCASYTLGAHLENVATTCQSLPTQCTSNCTYCLGPYGQK